MPTLPKATKAKPDFESSSVYTIRQVHTGRFLDAYQSTDNEHGDTTVVTRPEQGNTTQQWLFTHTGYAHRISQVSTGRFLDAWPDEAHDFSVVTRPAQNNESQIWLDPDPLAGWDLSGRIQQLSTGRFLDAWPDEAHDFSVVTRPAQNNDSQRWQLNNVNWIGPPWQLIQKSKYVPSPFSRGSLFMDAYTDGAHDWSVVNRTFQGNDTQQWDFETVGFIYEIQQVSSERYLDAFTGAGDDWAAVTRPSQNNASQNWLVMPGPGASWTIRQLQNRRFLDAYEQSHDHAAVTRGNQNNNSQRWLIEKA